MNGAVDVAHIFHDQRVVATHLQCQDLARLAGKLLMQEAAGTEEPVKKRPSMSDCRPAPCRCPTSPAPG